MARLLTAALGASALLAATLAAAPARAETDAPAAKTRTSCDSYGRCFEFSGVNDLLTSAGANLWQRNDPMALANGTPGDPIVEGLPDD